MIPLHIYQTWYTKDLPQKMSERVELLKRDNPMFKHHLYDDNDCREFIQKYFKQSVVEAYDTLIPGAYKADLFRLCILYIKGGIYMDIKLACINGFSLMEFIETGQDHFVLDRPSCINGIYNAFIVSTKNNMFLYKCIKQLVKNVKKRFYGNTALAPTGPEMMYDVMIKKQQIPVNIDMHFLDPQGGYIVYKDKLIISTDYPEYNEEISNTYKDIGIKKYFQMWEERNIYK
jgi:mannosyltransferase OCH1-like enzyme